ncbi:MAG: precorrin-6y C5,15-methyltransferase (decarboxylating) subunit CbiE [Shinella sp.]|nr:precorrin-6y C5,15-methyltransferase (decarboxylating) subunit CbiE [Shinella sp.]
MSKPEASDSSAKRRWLSIVGIGEDGLAGLGDAAKAAIAGAEIVFGGVRHLELADAAIMGERRAWLSPFERSVEAVLAARGRPVAVLASGDPFFHGAGVTLSRSIGREEMTVYPAPSSFSLAASRMGWALQDTVCISLHGRPLELILPHLHPGSRILALTSDSDGPRSLAALLSEFGFGGSALTVLEALGGPRERVGTHMAGAFSLESVDMLNVCAVEVAASEEARILAFASGLDDSLFEHDGQITKREVRAITLSSLSPRRGELLWDIGAGSGSIGIEWMLADPSLRAIAVEGVPARAARIRRNAMRFGVPGMAVVEGYAPDALRGLAAPDAIFIGGGGSDGGVADAAIAALKPGGRIVANAVTTEMEAMLLSLHDRLGGALTRIEITRASPVGTMTGWRPAMPVMQWSWVKPAVSSSGRSV